jgi:hypothetical protein
MPKSLTLKEELLRDIQGCIQMSSGITRNCVAIREKVEECDEKEDIDYLEMMKKDIDALSKVLLDNVW